MIKIEKRLDLQGLRAVAVLLVIMGHAGLEWASGGYVGVDVFFVLSGYLISGLLISEINSTGRLRLFDFYARRLKRLLPALLFMLVGSSLLASFLLSPEALATQLQSVGYAVAWLSNFYFYFIEFDYFNDLADKDLFLHTWSLGVEEQFYLVWPFLLLGLFSFLNKFKSLGGRLSLLRIFFVIILLVFGASIWATSIDVKTAFYLMPFRVWQFSLGALVFLFSVDDKWRLKPTTDNRLWSNLTFLVGIFLILASSIYYDNDFAYPGAWALSPSVGAGLVIVSGSLSSFSKCFLKNPVMVWLGDRSYSLYLWHWPILMIGFSLGFEGDIPAIIFMLLVVVLLSIISYRYVELPFWKGGLSNISESKAFGVCIGAMLVVGFGLVSYHGTLQERKGKTDNVSQNWAQDVPEIYRLPCDQWYYSSDVKPCVFGSGAENKTVVFIGDSIGAQWFSMIPYVFPIPEWKIIVLTKSSCPMVDEDFFYKRIDSIYEVCSVWRSNVLKDLEKIKPNVIVAGSASTYKFTERQWIDGSGRVFDVFSEVAEVVFIIPGTPWLAFNGPNCLSRNLTNGNSINRDACVSKEGLSKVEPVTKWLNSAADRFDNVQLLNLNDLVCPGGVCRAITRKGLPVYRDTMHLTDTFVRSHLPEIKARFKME